VDLGLGGRLAVVTGAAQGIGLAIATAFRGEGARVLLVDRSDAVTAAAADIGGEALVVDLSTLESAAIIADAAQRLGGAQVLVNNAGVTKPGNIAEIADDDWDFVLSVNLDAVFRLTRGLWMQLQSSGGAIVNMASFAGKRATLFGNNASYTVSKHGVAGLTRAAAMDGAKVGIRVNAVAPGVVSTEMVKAHDAATRQQIAGMIPLGRYAEPAEIADAVLFLASRRASHVTGEVMNVNGGLVMD
jgi:NAD(P)-dependent dehydrogenase (short-subunit alcohol dehydrogenase family)